MMQWCVVLEFGPRMIALVDVLLELRPADVKPALKLLNSTNRNGCNDDVEITISLQIGYGR